MKLDEIFRRTNKRPVKLEQRIHKPSYQATLVACFTAKLKRPHTSFIWHVPCILRITIIDISIEDGKVRQVYK